MEADRRDFVKAAGAAALTTNIFTGNVKGANGRVNAAFIGMGKMGRSNLGIAMKQENLAVSRGLRHLSTPNLETGRMTMANKKFPRAKAI